MSYPDTKISVIVPVYKVEPWLRQCVDSMLAQTHKNLEIILVDDGSPDNCPAICDEYAAKDSRVVVVHKKNGGPHAARNAGLDIATGDYVTFVDSDDWIAPEMYEKLLDALLEHNAEAAVCGYVECDEEGNVFREIEPYRSGYITGLEAARNTTYSTVSREGETDGPYEAYSACWNKLYHRNVFETLRFDETLNTGDDTLAVFQALSGIERLAIVNEPLYFYLQRGSSITHGKFAAVIQGRYQMAEKMLRFAQPELRSACIQNLAVFVFARINSLAMCGDRKGYDQFQKECRTWGRELRSEYQNYTRKYQIALLLFWYFPDLFWSIELRRMKPENKKDHNKG